MKMTMRMMLVLSVSLLALNAVAENWSASVGDDILHEVRPGGVGGRAFWNDNAIMFMYPPAFGFRSLERLGRKIAYVFQVCDAKGSMHYFTADRPTASLAPVWAKLPTGYTTVTCRAQDGSNCSEITVGTRAFWKSAPFKGNYAARKRDYGEAAKLALTYVLKSPSVRYFMEKGELDPGFKYNAYPTKMLSSIIKAGCQLAESDPALREESLALATKAADWLIAHSEKADAALPNFPPTYMGKEVTAGQYAGQVMLVYPCVAALAYMRLFEVTKASKYLGAAEAIASVFLRLQASDGTWPIKMYLKDGKRIGKNSLVPISAAIPMMEKLHALTGKMEYRKSADLAFGDLERKRIATWNWEGQFEDVAPSEPYLNLTFHDAGSTALYIAENFPNDAKKLSLARELARFAEDQFVCWEKPFTGMNYSSATAMLNIDSWRVPGVLEQYYWYNPIDGAAAKMIRIYLALWRAEKNPLDMAKARALGDSITREQTDEGLIPTHWSFKENANTIWMNCHIGSALALDELDRTVRNIPAEAPEKIRIQSDHGWPGHLQGVASDGKNVFFCWTRSIVKVDFAGNVLKEVDVPSHHGDLCVVGGKVYVAVNLGKFNQPSGKEAKSEVRAYDADTLKCCGTWQVPELIYGAGGITHYQGRFYVVGGLPDGMDGNAVYEYDGNFRFLRKIHLAIGWTQLGIQTVDALADGTFRFGIYGKIIGRTDKETKAEPAYALAANIRDFNNPAAFRRFDLPDAAVGILRIGECDFCAANWKTDRNLPNWESDWIGLIRRVREFQASKR